VLVDATPVSYSLKSNMKVNHNISISSPPDREKLVAEIFWGNDQWAEINQERENLEVEFYPRTDGSPWRINYDDALKALEQAKEKLESAQGD